MIELFNYSLNIFYSQYQVCQFILAYYKKTAEFIYKSAVLKLIDNIKLVCYKVLINALSSSLRLKSKISKFSF